jgi:hypothetical protein
MEGHSKGTVDFVEKELDLSRKIRELETTDCEDVKGLALLYNDRGLVKYMQELFRNHFIRSRNYKCYMLFTIYCIKVVKC